MRSHPKYDLDSSIEVARSLHAHGGRASAPELAALLGYGGTNNGAYLNRVAAARAFGLIAGEGRGATISVTDRALAILQPDYPEGELQARLEAFTAVPLFAEFFERYEAKPLPDQPGLQNALVSMGITEKTVGIALARLMSSAHQAGLFKVSPNKLIRPSVTSAGSPSANVPITPGAEAGTNVIPSRSKLLDALIEELPPEREWDEQGLKEWLDMFGRALRIHYKIPRPVEKE